MSRAVIIGGGPAGATAAIMLARAGCTVTLIERNASPTDKVCGDFLSAEAIEVMAALDFDVAALAPAPISALRLVHRNRMATTRLPFPALGVTRRALDEALLRHAKASGATILRGHSVRSLTWNNGLLRLDCGSLSTTAADSVFLATGKHDVRGVARAGPRTDLIGMKMYYMLDPSQQAALRNNVELVLFAGGYAGLQLVQSEQAVLCVLVPAARLRAADGQWDALLDSLTRECPHLAERLMGARAMIERPLAVAGLPYGYTHAPNRRDPPGLFRIGDQAAVIPSLTGDGVALALASAMLASRTWLEHGNVAVLYHRAWARRMAPQMRLSAAVHRACVAPAVQPWVLRACRFWPGAMRLAATRTRIREATPGRALCARLGV